MTARDLPNRATSFPHKLWLRCLTPHSLTENTRRTAHFADFSFFPLDNFCRSYGRVRAATSSDHHEIPPVSYKVSRSWEAMFSYNVTRQQLTNQTWAKSGTVIVKKDYDYSNGCDNNGRIQKITDEVDCEKSGWPVS